MEGSSTRNPVVRSPRFWVLAGFIIALAFVHQLNLVADPLLAQMLDVVPYLPIILGAIWFGLGGGVICALLTSTCFFTHMVIHQGAHFDHNLPRILNIAMYNVVGIVTGYLSRKQIALAERYRATAEKLEESYAELQRKTDALIESEKELNHAHRLAVLGELTAGLAHEIGNPLGAIKGAAEILAEGLEPSDKRRRFAQLLLKEIDRLDAVVRGYLGYTRKEGSSGATALGADLGTVLGEVAALLSPQCERGRLALEIQIDRGLPQLPCDPVRIKQVFLNLVLNAVQATPPGGNILISAKRNGESVACDVADTGCGMPPEVVERLFQPFFTTKSEGTGLGLRIARRIISGYGGTLEVESEPGKGTKFKVNIPLKEPVHGPQVDPHSR